MVGDDDDVEDDDDVKDDDDVEDVDARMLMVMVMTLRTQSCDDYCLKVVTLMFPKKWRTKSRTKWRTKW